MQSRLESKSGLRSIFLCNIIDLKYIGLSILCPTMFTCTICDFVFMLLISVLTDAKMRLETLHVDSTY